MCIEKYVIIYRLFQVDFKKLVADTSASKLWGTGAVTKTGHFLNNISNVLRIVLLLNFGGIYLDSDVISLRPMPDKVNGRNIISVILKNNHQ